MEIDQTIKRAAVIAFVVVIVAKLASAMFDGWMGDTQDEMVESQQAFVDHQKGLAQSQSAAQQSLAIAENCEKAMDRSFCTHPKNFREIGTCLRDLRFKHCDQLPRVQLCAAVEELMLCSDPFEDQKKNGCNRLRRDAGCKQKPAPDDREDLWMISLDDGFWKGGDD